MSSLPPTDEEDEERESSSGCIFVVWEWIGEFGRAFRFLDCSDCLSNCMA
jgi:hypothetical protein